ncbi:MAG: YcxB family protein [Burkholderiales bacterium]|nr:YcxB family protein [Burkholderiales bacterium]
MITATLTVDDYIAAHRLHHQGRRLFYVIGAAVLILGVGLSFTTLHSWAPIAVFTGIGGLLGQWWDDRVGLPQKVRKLYGQFKGLSDPMSFNWDSECIEGSSAEGHGKRKWSDYVRLKEDDDIFLLYITDQLWHAYPKRWFTSPEQLAEFRTYASKAGEA